MKCEEINNIVKFAFEILLDIDSSYIDIIIIKRGVRFIRCDNMGERVVVNCIKD
jgi:hypothetical protein